MPIHEGWITSDDVDMSQIVRVRMKVWIDEHPIDAEWSCGKVRYVVEFANRPFPVPVNVEMRAGHVIQVRVRELG